MSKPAITLQEQAHNHFGKNPDFDVMLHGVKTGDAFYNMTGYCAEIPLPSGAVLYSGEGSLASLKRNISAVNREWAQAA